MVGQRKRESTLAALEVTWCPGKSSLLLFLIQSGR